uniref:TonB-dependent receptor n=1 Tax=Fusobacterium sp. TaxID=68766 RepID=UPI0026101B79
TYIVTQEQIQEKNYKNVEEVLRDSPGVIVNNTAFGPKIDMRGSGEKSLSRVKVIVDGISINPTEDAMASLPINSIPIESVKKIEVIPGGGATLYGSGSVGGVINIITNSNATKNNFFMDLKYGSFDNRNFGFAGGQNVTDKLYLNYGFNYINSEGYRESEENQSTIYLAGFDYKINDKNKIRFQARHGNEDLNGTNEVSKDILAHDRKAAGLNMDIETETNSYTFDYEHRYSDKLVLAGTLFYQEQNRDIDTESIDDINISVYNGKYTEIKNSYIFKDVKSLMDAKFSEKKYGIKLKANYNYDNGNFILGYDYYSATNKRNSFVKSETLKNYYDGKGSYLQLDPEDRLPVINRVNIDLSKESHGLYAFNKYDLNEKILFTTGVRGEYTSYSGSRKNGPNTMPFITPKIQEIETDEELENYAGELGVLYKYSDSGNVYMRYERGFVTPFASQLTDKIHDTHLKNESNPNATKVPEVNVASIYVANGLKSEITDTFEVGVRDYIFNSLVSLSLYVTDTTDEITMIQSGVTNPAIKRWQYKNIGKTRRMGLELETEQDFGDIGFSQSVSLINAEVLKGDSNYGILKGDKVPLAPELKATFGAKYRLTENLSLLGNYTYTGKKEARELDENDNIFRYNIGGYGVIDLGALYAIDEYSNFKFGIKNIGGTKYNLRETSLEAYPAPERNYYVELNVKF